MDYAYMGFNDLFDHLLEPKRLRNGQADATPVDSIPRPGASKPFGRRRTDPQAGREGAAALRRTQLPSPPNKVEWNR